MNANAIIRKHGVEEKYYSQDTNRGFELIDNAKNLCNYHLANIVFVWLMERKDVQWGIEILPEEQEEKKINDCTPDEIRWTYYHYHSLLTLRKNDLYACIPLPMLAGWVIAKALNKVLSPVPRLDHCREIKEETEILWTQKELDFFQSFDVDHFFNSYEL